MNKQPELKPEDKEALDQLFRNIERRKFFAKVKDIPITPGEVPILFKPEDAC